MWLGAVHVWGGVRVSVVCACVCVGGGTGEDMGLCGVCGVVWVWCVTWWGEVWGVWVCAGVWCGVAGCLMLSQAKGGLVVGPTSCFAQMWLQRRASCCNGCLAAAPSVNLNQ